MNTYLALKWLHIVSSVVLVGTGFGTAFYLYMVNRSGSLAAQAVVGRLVVKADLWFTTPAVIVQPLTGAWLVQTAGWRWQTPWITTALVLYAVAGLCWLPVLALQLRMANDAARAVATATPLPARYAQDTRLWERLGYPAFAAMLIIFGLMVFKPQAV
jgi:uncharacterized membrane protein